MLGVFVLGLVAAQCPEPGEKWPRWVFDDACYASPYEPAHHEFAYEMPPEPVIEFEWLVPDYNDPDYPDPSRYEFEYCLLDDCEPPSWWPPEWPWPPPDVRD